MATRPFTLLTELFGDPVTAAIFSEERTVRSWLETEAALAAAQAEHGVLEPEVARAIGEACAPANVDLAGLWDGARNVGYPILSLVRMIDAALPPSAAGHVHLGATTQDIMDTGLALQLGEAVDRLLALVGTMGDALATLVERHRGTVMAARTHGQQAVPTTFGAKVAVHLEEMARRRRRLAALRPEVARVSLFGAGGTSAALGPEAPAVRTTMARLLDLEPADVPWHVARDGVAEFGLACATLAAACGRFAREVVALSRTEIGEVAEQDGHHRGASSTMPQKENPISSEAVIGMSVTAAALSSALLGAMEPRHERAAGEWQVEWEAIPLLAGLAAGCALNAGAIAAGLRVFPAAMRANLERDSGFLMAEAYMMRLAPELGRERAHDFVYDAVRDARRAGRSLEESLAAATDGHFEPIAPGDYVGDPDVACDAALRAWRETPSQMSTSEPSEMR
jgi:3-carboxy-cis,cis-muconate cycloisomerase